MAMSSGHLETPDRTRRGFARSDREHDKHTSGQPQGYTLEIQLIFHNGGNDELVFESGQEQWGLVSRSYLCTRALPFQMLQTWSSSAGWA